MKMIHIFFLLIFLGVCGVGYELNKLYPKEPTNRFTEYRVVGDWIEKSDSVLASTGERVWERFAPVFSTEKKVNGVTNGYGFGGAGSHPVPTE